MNQRKISYTAKGFENLKKELEELLAKRPEAVKTLSRARDMGDLSENGLYRAAKFEVGQLDRKIAQINRTIPYVVIANPSNNLYVQIGHSVKIQTEHKILEYEIVGEFEADPKQNKISNKSPIGFALMGRKTGEKVTIKTLKGILEYEILSIR